MVSSGTLFLKWSLDRQIGQQRTTQLNIDKETTMMNDNAQNAADAVRAFAYVVRKSPQCSPNAVAYLEIMYSPQWPPPSDTQ